MSMRKLFVLTVVAAAAFAPALAGSGNANFTLGSRSMGDDDLWDGDLDTQSVFGVTVDFSVGNWPVNLAVGLQAGVASDDSDFGDVDASVTELFVGVQKTWDVQQNLHPFVGGGLTYASVLVEADDISDDLDDSSVGLYIEGGVYWRLGSRFNLGVNGRFVTGTDVEDTVYVSRTQTSYDFDGDVDYFQLGLLLGWGWPAS